MAVVIVPRIAGTSDADITSVNTGTGLSGGGVSGDITISLDVPVQIVNGGTGQTTASAAINAILPDQTGHAGEVLTTNGTVASWGTDGGGTVSSVGLALPTDIFDVSGSPVTSSGTLTATLDDQAANSVFAGPTTGSPDTPAFRSLVAADIPALPYASSALTDAHVFVGNASNVAVDVAISGDVTLANTGAVTLNNVNANVGSFGSSTSIPNLTVNSKGLVTAAGGNAVVAPAGTLTGTTLAAGVTLSSLTSVGTITSGTWNGTTIAIANGGTGQTTANAGFNALSPMTTGGDLIYGGASGAATRLANGSAGQVLTSAGTTLAPTWETPTTSGGTVTSVAATVPSVLSISGSPITTSGTLAIGYSGTALPVANGGTNSTAALNNNRVVQSSGGAIVEAAAITAARALISDANGIPTHATTTATEIGYVNGVTSAIQTQLNAKGAGTVTSVAASVPSLLSISGSPITTSGTLAISYSGTALPVANGGTGTTTAFTSGSVVFADGSGVYAQDNANLFWDDTNNRLGIGTATPGFSLDVNDTIRTLASHEGASANQNSSTAVSIANINNNLARITLTGNATVTLPATTTVASGFAYSLTVRILQDGTGSRTLAWATSGGTNTIVWDGGTALAPSAGANTVTVYQFLIFGGETVWYASRVWSAV